MTAAVEVGFIGGYGRSGSTLLERIIASLPGVCALGEVLHLPQRGIIDNEKCGCGQRFHECSFWSEVGQLAFGGWQRVDVEAFRAFNERLDRLRYIPADLAATRLSRRQAMLREYAAFFVKIYTSAATITGAQLVIDSSKNASTAFALRANDEVPVRFVHLVRDSRAVAYSWTKSVRRPEAEIGSEKQLMDQYSPMTSSMLWNANNLAFDVLGRRSAPVRRFRYEDLLTDPIGEIERIGRFLGVDATPVRRLCQGRTVRFEPAHQVAGNPMRFDGASVTLRHDDAWRTEMPAPTRRLVTTMTWPLMRRYGYLPASGAEA